MGNQLRDLRLRSGLNLGELEEVARQVVPGIDKPLLSKLEKPERYGIALTYEAMREIFETADPDTWAKYKRHTDGHRLGKRIYCRLPDDVFRELKDAIREDGYSSFQEWIYSKALVYLEERSDRND